MAKTQAMYPSGNLTPQAIDGFLSEWAVIVEEVGPEAFDAALTRHIRNAKFFPSVAELREAAGMNLKDEQAVDASQAWEWVISYLRRWGVEGMPQFYGGKMHVAPEIPERIDYAIRRVGGLRAINQCEIESQPFMRKDFAEAYRQFETAEIRGYVGSGDARKLLGEIKALAAAKQIQ